MIQKPSVAVIGAGMSGLVCASHLIDADFAVKVYDKGRGSGGRMSTRREGRFQFDHGAQYFTCRDPQFALFIDTLIDLGVVAQWEGRIYSYENGSLTDLEGDITRYIGIPTMSAVTRHLASRCNVSYDTLVERIEREGEEWLLFDSEGKMLGSYGALVLAVPAPQAQRLLAALPELLVKVSEAEMAPCWAVMLGFSERLELNFDGLFINGSSLSWAARNSSKYGREGETWVLHATAEWSAEHIEREESVITDLLSREFQNLTGLERFLPVYTAAHRWRYALPVRTLNEVSIFHLTYGIGICGDWCAAPRVEGAFLSGLDLAKTIIVSLS